MKGASVLLALVLLHFSQITFSAPGGASSASKLPRWQLQFGAMATNLEQRFQVPAVYASKVSQVRGLIGVQRNIFLSRKWYLIPEFFTLLPWRSGADSSTKVFTSQLGLRFAFSIFSWLRINAGPGIFWESYLSQSDAVNLSNGTGNSTFYTPNSWRQVLLFSAQAGLDLCFSQSVCLSAGIVAPDPIDSVKRRLDGVIRLGIAL